jgi:endonuclease G
MRDGKLVALDGRLLDPNADVNDGDIRWMANEGTRVSALVESLHRQKPERADERRLLSALLETTGDPLLTVEAAAPAPIPGNFSIPDPNPEADMGAIRFEFSGPVTIQIGAGVAIPPGVSVRISDNGHADVDAGAIEKVLRFDPHYDKRKGYDSKFLKGQTIALPTLNEDHIGEPLRDPHGKPWIIPYYHYSLVMNQTRRMMSWTASNVDYSPAARKKTKTRKEYGGENWRLDPRVATAAPGLQIEDENFYDPAKQIDRGHIVRREDSCWGGTTREAEFGNSDTYHWTNCTPQSKGFNQSSQKGIWGKFEEYLESQIKTVGGRMTLFAGPVFKAEDKPHGYEHQEPILVPMEFWKVVVCVIEEHGQPRLQAYGLIFDQTDAIKKFGFEKLNLDAYEMRQHPIEDISKKTGVVFDPKVVAADVLAHGPGDESLRVATVHRIRTLEDVILR